MTTTRHDADEVARRIRHAFRALDGLGFVTKPNFMCCSGCAGVGIANQTESAMQNGKRAPLGCAFYHAQDNDDLKFKGKVYIRFGDISTHGFGDVGFDTATVGGFVRQALEVAGLKVEWNGSPDVAIFVDGLAPSSTWQHRSMLKVIG